MRHEGAAKIVELVPSARVLVRTGLVAQLVWGGTSIGLVVSKLLELDLKTWRVGHQDRVCPHDRSSSLQGEARSFHCGGGGQKQNQKVPQSEWSP